MKYKSDTCPIKFFLYNSVIAAMPFRIDIAVKCREY